MCFCFCLFLSAAVAVDLAFDTMDFDEPMEVGSEESPEPEVREEPPSEAQTAFVAPAKVEPQDATLL